MANTLVSPGVDVSIIDESFYATAGNGTVPLVLIATQQNKQYPGGSGIAEGTLSANQGKLYLLSSQREAIQTFGYPKFYKTDIGTPMHGYELNEYGLLSLYQYLGVANRAYAISAPIDLGQLYPNSYAPTGSPVTGTYWFDIYSTTFGVFTSNGNSIPGVAWQPNSTTVVNTMSQVQNVLLGTVYVADPTNITFLTTSVQLVINEIPVTVTGSLNQVIASINAANIPGIVATAFRNGMQSTIMITNTNAGAISTFGTIAPVIAQLGLGKPTFLSPQSSLGSVGSFAVVTLSTDNVIYQKLIPQDFNGNPDSLATAAWFPVGSAAWQTASPTVSVGTAFSPASFHATDSMSINGTTVVVGTLTSIATIVTAINAANIPGIIASAASTTQLRITNIVGGDIVLQNVSGTPLTVLGLTSVNGNRLFYSSNTKYPQNSVSGDIWVKTTQFNSGANYIVRYYSAVTSQWMVQTAPLVGSTTPTGTQTQVQSDDAAASKLYGGSLTSGVLYVRYNLYGSATFPSASHQIRIYNGTVWEPLVYQASASSPTSAPADGTMWYSEDFAVDIMVNYDGSDWVGYGNYAGNALTDPNGPFLQATAPLTQVSGNPLQQNDIWINTSTVTLEGYPMIYRYNASTTSWTLIDNTDSTTPFGIVFADARQDSGAHLLPSDTYNTYSTAMADLLQSNVVDPDCPDARLYPDGTLLFNLRISTLNVKAMHSKFFVGGDYDPNNYTAISYNVGNTTYPPLVSPSRWVTISGLKTDGTPYMGRKAQRQVVVSAMKTALSQNTDVLAETIFFNLIAAPGYVEMIDEMIQLNDAKKDVAFIIGDTPCRLQPTAQAIQNWISPVSAGTALPATEDQLGISGEPYVGVYYPWGLSTNYDGSDAMIPPSSMALQVFAYNDSIAYPWYAPAGPNRGIVNNASTVGYLNSNNKFTAAILGQGQRDVIYLNNVNPIAYIPNQGLMVYGQKTLNGQATALDRVNVARLCNYIRYNVDLLAQQFLFEPNVQHTRDTVQITFERWFSDLIATNAIYDFVVICDTSNNTPPRIDRNELWVDIAIQPVKTIEFIYIPIRLENSSTALSTVYSASNTSTSTTTK